MRSRNSIIVVLLFALAVAALANAADGRATYAVSACHVNGVAVELPPQELTIFSDRTYAWAIPERHRWGTTDRAAEWGTFTYNPRDQKFEFDGALQKWGRAKLSGEDLSIYVGYKDEDGDIWEMSLTRVPETTICPIWPLCT
jgi:hypothetical protein